MRKINYIVFIVISVALICFDLYKSAHASFTHDESYTYLHYVNTGVMDIISYRDPDANNHILNTLLMKLFSMLFGSSELILRLPNILAHVLYLVFTYKLLDRYCPKNVILFFILANANPYLVDFFALARGYGLAIGLITAGFYYYSRHLENEKQRDHILSLIFICLASLANFALLNVLLIIILIHNIFQFFIYRHNISLKSLWQTNKLNIIASVLLSGILYEPIRKVIKYKLIYIGGNTGFWEDTVRALLYCYAYNAPYEEIITIILKIFVVGCSTLFVFRAFKYFLKNNSMDLTQKLVLFFGMIIFFITVSSMAQNSILGTPYVMGRAALFIYPVFILMCCFLFEDLWNHSSKYPIRGIALSMSGVFFLHTCYSLNASWYYEWDYDRNTKNMLHELAQKKSIQEQNISMGITWLYAPTVNFYRHTLGLNWLQEVDGNSIKLHDDYYYLHFYDLNGMPKHESELMRYYPTTQSYLIKNRKKIFYLKSVNGKYVCADGGLNNILIANRESVQRWETFTLLRFEKNECAILAYNNQFLSVELGQHNEISATRDKIADWEIFTLIELDNNYVVFKAANGKYMGVDERSLQLYARADSIGKQEKFKMVIK